MANIIISLWLLFLALIIFEMFYSLKGKKQYCIPFSEFKKIGIPYITIDIQGHLLNMIVDSGAEMSVITEDTLPLLSYEDSTMKANMTTMVTGEYVPTKVVTIPFTVNNTEMKESFIVHNTEDLCSFQVCYGIKAHGILGNEFLEKTKCKIDYSKHTLFIKNDIFCIKTATTL